jgi:cell division protein FtsI/penicillin-binding protein 2
MQLLFSKMLAVLAATSLVALTQVQATTLGAALTKADSGLAASPPSESLREASRAGCARAMAQGAVCVAANTRAIELMNARALEAATLVLDVQTGALVAFAATPGSNAPRKGVGQLNVTTPVLPLSLAKLFLVASWWDRGLPESSFDCIRSAAPEQPEPMTLHEMIAIGCDLPAKQMAIALRKSIGAEAVLADLERFGFGPRSKSSRDDSFWAELAPEWRDKLVPTASYTLLSAKTKDSEWADTLSLGETNFIVTVLHVSRFLQAVGNKGMLLPPVARKEVSGGGNTVSNTAAIPRRIMQENTAIRLQAAMRDVVQRGSARAIAHALDGTGWQIGGKTGTGPGPAAIGPQSDGWFAGLVFDPQGGARFTVATFVRHGGRGGGNAAMISAQIARHLIENGSGDR